MKFGDAPEGADDPRMGLWHWALQHEFPAYFEVNVGFFTYHSNM